MGYYVIMNEIERAEQDIGKKTMEWMGQLNAVGDQLQAYSGYLKEKSSGQTADSICSYLEEVHMYLLGQFYLLLNEMFERVVCYAEGFYEIEADTYSGEIAQESLENQEEVLEKGNTAFLKEAQTLEDGLAKVSDILPVKAPDTSAVENGFGELSGQAEELRTTIGEYEAKHLSEDFEVMEAMEELLQSFMAHYIGKRAVSIETYQSRSFLEYPEVRALVQVESIKDAGREKNLEELQRTTELFINRMEAEARREAGKQKFVKGLLIAGGAVVTIVTVVATAGTATPVVATAWGQAFVIGSAGMATVYGVSETIEGYDLYRLGAAGDTITIAKNPVRDVVFQGNEELYRLWGEGSVLLMQLGLGGAGVVKLYNAGGLKAIAVEGGKIITSSVAGDMTSRFMVDKLGMNETDAMLIGMLAGDVTYGGLNMLHGSLVERYRIESEVKSKILSTSEAEEYAFNAIKGSDNADYVVLGKFESGSATSYDAVAKDMDAQYFNLDNWNELSSQYSGEEIWKINERFLDIQTSSGREIYLSHNPADYIGDGSYYSREIQYLIDNGYKFIIEGDIWHAIR